MESVRALGVDINAPASESSTALVAASLSQLLSGRHELFSEATALGLTRDGDELVSSRDSRKTPLNKKLADDVITLLFCIKNKSLVPRSLLKNGKRCKDYLDASRRANIVENENDNSPSLPSLSSTSEDTQNVFDPQICTLSDSVRTSIIMKDINLLKNHVNDLRKDIAILHRRNHPPSVPSTCHIRIILPGTNPISAVLLETDGVSNLLGCPALTVVKISVNTLKVKIPKECLYTALLSSQHDSHLVHIWKNKLVKPISTSQAPCTSQVCLSYISQSYHLFLELPGFA